MGIDCKDFRVLRMLMSVRISHDEECCMMYRFWTFQVNVTIFDVFHANWVWNGTEIAQTSGEWLILCVQFDLLYKSMHLMVMKNKNWLGFLLCLQSLICQKMSYNITAKQNKNQNKHTSNWSWSLGIFCLSAMRKTLSS